MPIPILPIAALLPVVMPFILELIKHLSPAEAEDVRAKLNEAIDRRKAAVLRNEQLDAPREA